MRRSPPRHSICALLVSLVLAACGTSPLESDAAQVEPDGGALPIDARLDAAHLDAAHLDAAAPPGFAARYALSVEHPEGGAFDPEDRAFYVGSLADGSVHRIDAASGIDEEIFRETAPGTWWTLGMDVDAARRRLWVCAMDDQRETSSDDPPYDGYVWVFDLDSGERVASHALAGAFPNATCTDVAVAGDGAAYVTDRESPNVYRLTETDPPALFATDPALSAAVIGLNAIVVLPDQSALLAVLYLPSRLVRIDLVDGRVTEVDVDGDFSDRTPLLSGADGMALSEGGVLVQFTSQLVRVTPTLADWSAATATSIDVPAGMTDVLATPAGPYLLNGQAVQFALGGATEPFALVRFTGAL
ncbi:MAG: hypothetical protein M3Y87_33055 [Myxococcota bacterium]|nr:hypothetical protein [Myxococcota bacterium]